MFPLLLGAALFLVLALGSALPTSSHGHVISEADCEQFLFSALAELTYNAAAEDGTEWVERWKFVERPGQVEVHRPLAPAAQWKIPTEPEPLPVPPTSYWFDLDGDGRAEDVFFWLAPQLGCAGTIHLRWNPTLRGYVLVISGRDHT